MEWDFNANQTVDEETLARAPEAYRGAYEKGDDGKYAIAPAFKPFIESITGLGTALKAERGVTKTLKGTKDISEALKETFGFDKIEDVKAKWDEYAAAAAAGSKIDPAKIKADIQATFDKDMSKKDQQLADMQSSLERYMVKGSATSALAAAKGNTVLLEPHILARTKVVADNGEYVVRVLDASGDYRGNGRGGFMTVEDLVAEMKSDTVFAAAFESDAPRGSAEQQRGRQPSQQQQQQHRQRSDRDNMSPNDMIAAGLQARGG